MPYFLVVALTAGLPLQAQTFTFEVATIKANTRGRQGHSIHTDQGGFRTDSTSLFTLLQYALAAQTYQISGGPGWVRDLRFDANARNDKTEIRDIPPTDIKSQQARDARVRARLLNLLEDRFQVKLREEMKDLPMYSLHVDKGGQKLKVSTDPRGNSNTNDGSIDTDGITTDDFCEVLSSVLGRPVKNETDLTGLYDIGLKYSPESVANGLEADRPGDVSGPSIFTALREQLGLRLTGRKGPVKTWVIEKAEMPGEN